MSSSLVDDEYKNSSEVKGCTISSKDDGNLEGIDDPLVAKLFDEFGLKL